MDKSWFLRAGVVAAVCSAFFGTRLVAQAPVSPPRAGGVQSDPIRCWWTTDTRAVQVGERFKLVVTCGIIESGPIRTLAGMDQFDPTALMLAPFEVIGGVRHEDIAVPPLRYFQYEYTVRLLSDRSFGQDVDIPPIRVTYQLEAGDEQTRGREQTYSLPALPMRIVSRVPASAASIRDASRETFADIEARQTRVTEEFVAAGLLFCFAATFVGLALIRMLGSRRTRVPASARPLPIGTVLSGCLRETRLLKSDVARDGWTPELVSRALTIFRIAGAIAAEKPVSQTLGASQAREGQLAFRKGLLRPRRALVSAPTTADTVMAKLAGANGLSARTRAILDGLQEALRAFNAACYSPNGGRDSAALDAAFESGADAIKRLRALKWWPARTADAAARSVTELRSQA